MSIHVFSIITLYDGHLSSYSPKTKIQSVYTKSLSSYGMFYKGIECWFNRLNLYFLYPWSVLQDILLGCMEVYSLSPLSGQILKRLSPRPLLKTRSLSSCVRDTSPETSEDLAAVASFSQTSPRELSSPTSPPPFSIHAEDDEQVILCIH